MRGRASETGSAGDRTAILPQPHLTQSPPASSKRAPSSTPEHSPPRGRAPDRPSTSNRAALATRTGRDCTRNRASRTALGPSTTWVPPSDGLADKPTNREYYLQEGVDSLVVSTPGVVGVRFRPCGPKTWRHRLRRLYAATTPRCPRVHDAAGVSPGARRSASPGFFFQGLRPYAAAQRVDGAAGASPPWERRFPTGCLPAMFTTPRWRTTGATLLVAPLGAPGTSPAVVLYPSLRILRSWNVRLCSFAHDETRACP